MTLRLRRAHLGMLAEPSRRVAIPQLSGLDRTRRGNTALVLFAGDTDPTPFRGPGRTRTWALTARFFSPSQDVERRDLWALLDYARDAPDSRLVLRTYTASIPGLDDAAIVTVAEEQMTPVDGGHAWHVTFTATAVAGTLGA